MNIAAVLWDFDGTILDTMANHFLINREIYSLVHADFKKEQWPEALSSLENYARAEYETINWRDFYRKCCNFSTTQIDHIGRLWGEISSKNKTFVQIFQGIVEVIKKIKSPQGICSQNSSHTIRYLLQEYKIDQHFTSIIGNTDISFERQKPHPEAFLLSIEKLNIKNDGIIFYIGDHNEDIKFANNAETALKNLGYNFKVLSIAACYGRPNFIPWDIEPDYKASKTSDILDIIEQHNLVK